GWCGGDREGDPHGEAATWSVERPDLAAHRVEKTLGDRESEPDARAGVAVTQPLERFEDQRLVLVGHALAVVDHVDDHDLALTSCDHHRRPPRGRVFDRIAE